MHQPKFQLKNPFLFFILTMLIAGMITGTPAQSAQAQDIDPPTPTPEVEVQIVGGGPASAGEWPWQVALVWDGSSNFYQDQFCAGSLISEQWVVTAAHCITDESDGSLYLPGELDVVAGILDLATPAGGYQHRDVYQIIRHPSYNYITGDNDIALLQLSSSITLGGSGETATAAVTLAPASSGSFVNSSSWVTGWGREIPDPPGGYPTELLEVNIPIISNSDCSLFWGGIIQSNICAGVADGKDSCSGDSGGPLVVNLSGTWTLVGIVSSGAGSCGTAPGIYTRVSTFTNWINSIIPLNYVSSITRQSPLPSNASVITFNVTFPGTVTGVNITDFSLTTTGVSGASLNGVSGSGSSYAVTVNTGTGDGTIRLDLVDNDSILNSNSSPLGGTGAGNGNFTTGEVYTIDKTPPAVTSITAGGSNPSGSASVNFLVTFTEPVTAVDLGDFALNTTGVSGAALVNVSGSGTTRVVTVNTGSYNGTIRLDLIDNNTIIDIPTNIFGGAGVNSYTSGVTYTINKPNLARPVLSAPVNGKISSDTTPTFQWKSVPKAASYEIEIAIDSAFTPTVAYSASSIVGNTHTSTALAEGVYYWHVRAYDGANQPGAWSLTRTFTIDTTGPAAPVLSAPSGTLNTHTVAFRWSPSSGAVSYELRYDNDSNCSSPIATRLLRGTSLRTPNVPSGTYYWCVSAKDAYGNMGPMSASNTFTIAP